MKVAKLKIAWLFQDISFYTEGNVVCIKIVFLFTPLDGAVDRKRNN